jgi:hypothetical protein
MGVELGQTFGHWTVVALARVIIPSQQFWTCECSCGNRRDVRSDNLLNGRSRHCGCSKSPRWEDLSGKVYGRLTVVAFDHVTPYRHGTRTYWRCKCSCGTEKIIRSDGLKGGDNVSCGCKKVEQLTTHGDTGTPEHSAWLALFDRCRNPNNESFKDYGARGINICERWENYENFLADMGRKPTPKHSIERVRNNDGYQPDNCVWLPMREQSYNRRTTKMTVEKAAAVRSRACESQRVLAEEFGVSQGTISRILLGQSWL